MSRIGKQPIMVPEGVTVIIIKNKITVKGAKGTLERIFDENIKISLDKNVLTVERPNDEREMRSLHGTTRATLANMVSGVSIGFTKTLELVGVGYRAAAKGKGLTLSLGYSHPIEIAAIPGISFKVDGQTKILIEGIEKELVGEVAARIRAKRPPEPYKGKGIKYFDEIVRRKEGKKA